MTNRVEYMDNGQYPETMSSEQMEFWRRVVAVYMGILPELEGELQKAGGLSFFEFQVLEHLSAVPGPMSMSQLAARCNSSLSRLSHVARKLEARDLLVRSISSEDKRVTIAELTTSGRQLEQDTRGVYHRAIEQRILHALSPDELQHITSLLDMMLRRHNADHWLLSA